MGNTKKNGEKHGRAPKNLKPWENTSTIWEFFSLKNPIPNSDPGIVRGTSLPPIVPGLENHQFTSSSNPILMDLMRRTWSPWLLTTYNHGIILQATGTSHLGSVVLHCKQCLRSIGHARDVRTSQARVEYHHCDWYLCLMLWGGMCTWCLFQVQNGFFTKFSGFPILQKDVSRWLSQDFPTNFMVFLYQKRVNLNEQFWAPIVYKIALESKNG